jgi:superkiller protein 3
MVIALTIIILAISSFTTRRQVGHWQNSIKLFKHALASTTNNSLAHYNLGLALFEEGKPDEASPHFAEAARLNPYSSLVHAGWGRNLEAQGKISEAEGQYELALLLDTDRYYSHELHVNLGIIHAEKGDLAEADKHFREAIRFDPNYADAYYNRGNILQDLNRLDEAVKYFTKAISLAPEYADPHYGLGITKAIRGDLEEANGHFADALRLAPDDMDIRRRVESFRRTTTGRDIPQKGQLGPETATDFFK